MHLFYLTKRTSWAECALMEWPQMCERHPPGALGGPRLGLHTTKHSPQQNITDACVEILQILARTKVCVVHGEVTKWLLGRYASCGVNPA